MHRTPNAADLARITRILRMMAIGVPLALLLVLALDGLDWTDAGVIALTTVVLWLFVGVAGFTVGALRNLEHPPQQSPRQ
jgi:hypothetical protein